MDNQRSIKEQIEAARRNIADWSQDKRANVQIEGRDPYLTNAQNRIRTESGDAGFSRIDDSRT